MLVHTCAYTRVTYVRTRVHVLYVRVRGAAADAPACNSVEWRCGSGECVLLTQLCNGVRDCRDGTDEAQCPGDDHTAVGEGRKDWQHMKNYSRIKSQD